MRWPHQLQGLPLQVTLTTSHLQAHATSAAVYIRFNGDKGHYDRALMQRGGTLPSGARAPTLEARKTYTRSFLVPKQRDFGALRSVQVLIDNATAAAGRNASGGGSSYHGDDLHIAELVVDVGSGAHQTNYSWLWWGWSQHGSVESLAAFLNFLFGYTMS